MTVTINYKNVDFVNSIILPNSNNDIVLSIQETISNLPALNIINDEKKLSDTIDLVKKFSKDKKTFLIFGTGGSNLGARALINSCQKESELDIKFYDNIDPIYFQNSIKKLNLDKVGFIIISKSGSTPETLSQFSSIIEIFDNVNDLNTLYKNSLIITEDKNSPLAEIAKKNKCLFLEHEKNIGGRYSIFTSVGMVPAIIAGLDVKKIHAGALFEFKKNSQNNYLKIAQFFYHQIEKGELKNSVIMTYSDSLFYFGKWYLQLWAESLGKESKGITAIHAVGTTDQHSQLQLYLDGPRDKFFTFITTKHSNLGFKLNNKIMKDHKIEYLVNKTMGDLMQAEQQATIDTFKDNNFSFRNIHLDTIDEFSIGQLMAFSIMETVATCLYFNVDPFNQPAVEQGKILTKKYLS